AHLSDPCTCPGRTDALRGDGGLPANRGAGSRFHVDACLGSTHAGPARCAHRTAARTLERQPRSTRAHVRTRPSLAGHDPGTARTRPPRHEALEAHGPRTASAGARAVPEDARHVEGRARGTAQAVARDDAGTAPRMGRTESVRRSVTRSGKSRFHPAWGLAGPRESGSWMSRFPAVPRWHRAEAGALANHESRITASPARRSWPAVRPPSRRRARRL